MAKISGFVCVRNGIELDYCFEESIASLIPVCDEVVVCDSDSTDGTTEIIHEIIRDHPSVRYFNRPWTKPYRDIHWWTDWLNWTRLKLEHPMMLELDADEVLDSNSYPAIKIAADKGECRWFHRLNFWRDAQHLCPNGHYCGEQVVRLGPTELWMPSDEPHPEGEPEIRIRAGWPPSGTMRIFHYGALRKESAFLNKIRTVNGAFFGTSDERVEKAFKDGTPWVDQIEFTEVNGGETIVRSLQSFDETHPIISHDWLRERGYDPG